jgi:outer membrane receptor protein involved in Fe transport
MGAANAWAGDPLDEAIDIDIPAGTSLEDALLRWAAQAGVQIMMSTDAVTREKAPAIRGTPTARDALATLLRASGLTYTVDGNTVRVVPAIEVVRSAERRDATPETRSAAAKPGSGEGDSNFPQVVVTARKRGEALQDVPVPVTVLNPDILVGSRQPRVQDYYASVPGLNLSSRGRGDVSLSMRGITTGGITNPTVGVMIDDVPFGSTTALGSRTSVPDIDPSDLARIEVLRGPQGTLYGAGSIGGLLKFVTADATTERRGGRLEADVDDVRNGDLAGYGLRGAVNLPLSGDFALRASGFARRDPGYINDPVFHREGVNEVRVTGGHLSGFWHPTEAWSLKLSALLQDTTANGESNVTLQPGLGDLEQATRLPLGKYDHSLRSFSAIVHGELAGARLVSLTGYGVDHYSAVVDGSDLYGSASAALFGLPGVAQFADNRTNKLSQEVRFSGVLGQRLDWLLGFFYTNEDTPSHDTYYAADRAGNTSASRLLLDDPYPTTYSEYAAFGDVTFHLTDSFDLQIGGRESRNQQTYRETLAGPLFTYFGLPSPAVNPIVHTADDAFTYLLTPRLKLSRGIMMYARLASGYRPGGPNPTCILFSVPCHYGPDQTLNYELGVKAEVLDRTLMLDASAYYITWNDIQVQVNDPRTGAVYYTNASRARSDGLELALRTKPFGGFSASGWIAWNDARLTRSLPPGSAAVGSAGERLPYSSDFSASLALQDSFPFGARWTGLLGAAMNYVGARQDDFPAPGSARISLGGYTELNLSAGLRSPSWIFSLFANNVTDRRGILFFQPEYVAVYRSATYIQPRTVGFSVSRSF